MCGRYSIITQLKKIEQRFELQSIAFDHFDPMANISIGMFAPVIASDQPSVLRLMQFGLTPFWAKKKMYLFNARSEGDHNKDNDPQYHGTMGIIKKPSFRHTIRSKRCLVIADAFIEGSKKEKLNRPFLIYMRKKGPFALAGIWDTWTNKETGEITESFSIITTTANSLLQKIGHHRSPVIISEQHEKEWLSEDLSLGEVTSLLRPYPSEELNAYPISNRIKSTKIQDLSLLEPTGNRIYPEFDYEIYRELILQGMGSTRARLRKKEETPPPEQGLLF